MADYSGYFAGGAAQSVTSGLEQYYSIKKAQEELKLKQKALAQRDKEMRQHMLDQQMKQYELRRSATTGEPGIDSAFPAKEDKLSLLEPLYSDKATAFKKPSIIQTPQAGQLKQDVRENLPPVRQTSLSAAGDPATRTTIPGKRISVPPTSAQPEGTADLASLTSYRETGEVPEGHFLKKIKDDPIWYNQKTQAMVYSPEKPDGKDWFPMSAGAYKSQLAAKAKLTLEEKKQTGRSDLETQKQEGRLELARQKASERKAVRASSRDWTENQFTTQIGKYIDRRGDVKTIFSDMTAAEQEEQKDLIQSEIDYLQKEQTKKFGSKKTEVAPSLKPDEEEALAWAKDNPGEAQAKSIIEDLNKLYNYEF